LDYNETDNNLTRGTSREKKSVKRQTERPKKLTNKGVTREFASRWRWFFIAKGGLRYRK